MKLWPKFSITVDPSEYDIDAQMKRTVNEKLTHSRD